MLPVFSFALSYHLVCVSVDADWQAYWVSAHWISFSLFTFHIRTLTSSSRNFPDSVHVTLFQPGKYKIQRESEISERTSQFQHLHKETTMAEKRINRIHVCTDDLEACELWRLCLNFQLPCPKLSASVHAAYSKTKLEESKPVSEILGLRVSKDSNKCTWFLLRNNTKNTVPWTPNVLFFLLKQNKILDFSITWTDTQSLDGRVQYFQIRWKRRASLLFHQCAHGSAKLGIVFS